MSKNDFLEHGLTGMINRAYQSGWNDNYTITVTYWTSSHGRGQSRQGSQVGKGMSKNDFSEHGLAAYQSDRYDG